jgi:predicted NUDIX family NTP pyrophosphohydrolase
MSGKIIHAFAIEGDLDASLIHSNNFSIEWPPSSGKIQQFPEIDKGEWFTPTEAKVKLSRAQVAFINELMSILNYSL